LRSKPLSYPLPRIALALGALAWTSAALAQGPQDSPKPIPQWTSDAPAGVPDDAHAHPQPADGLRSITCPTGSVPEGEPNCGIPTDNFNGGCNSQLQFFSNITCGQTVCGTAAFNGAVRDTDWYQVVLPQKKFVTWTVTSDFKAVIGLIAGTNGVPNCALATHGIDPFAIVSPGQSGSVTACLNPGTWWFFVGPATNQPNVNCGAKYYANISCASVCPTGACCLTNNTCFDVAGVQACLAMGGRYQGDFSFCAENVCNPPGNDDCTHAEVITCGSSVFPDLRNATLVPGEQTPICAQPQIASVWYKLIGTGNPVSVTTCDSYNLDPGAKDSILGVYLANGSCTSMTLIGCSDDAGCGPTERLSSVCFSTSLNSNYYIQVLPFSSADRAVYKLDVICPCNSVILGVCCLPDGNCINVTRSTCNVSSGSYKGDGITCAQVTCENIPFPPNDTCDAAPVLSVPGSVDGYTLYATPDTADIPSCGFPAPGPGVWYKVVGDGHEFTADTCSPVTDYDTRMLVFCGDCVAGPLVCVGASDDAFGTCGSSSQLTWCTTSGQTYSILVTGGANTSGHFRLTLARSPAACPNPVSCSPACTVTCPPGAVSENEPPCSPGYIDATNGGCTFQGNPHGSITCGQTVCGTSGTFSLNETTFSRDTDWFRFTLQQRSTVTWTVTADFLVQAYILNDDCSNIGAYAGAYGNPCQNVICSATLDPGTYNAFVAPQFFQDQPCGGPWKGTLTCAPTSDNGACCLGTCNCVVTSESACLLELGGYYWAGPATTCAQTVCNTCPTDFTHDGTTNTADLVRLLLYFGQGPQADINCDGQTNTSDLTLLLLQFGRNCP